VVVKELPGEREDATQPKEKQGPNMTENQQRAEKEAIEAKLATIERAKSKERTSVLYCLSVCTVLCCIV